MVVPPITLAVVSETSFEHGHETDQTFDGGLTKLIPVTKEFIFVDQNLQGNNLRCVNRKDRHASGFLNQSGANLDKDRID